MPETIHEEYGIMLLRATRRMAALEGIEEGITAVGVVRCELTEAFDILTKNACEDEKKHVFETLRKTSEKIMQGFIQYFSYLITNREKIRMPLDGKDLEFTFWLSRDNTISAKVSREHVYAYLEEIRAKEETRSIAEFLMDATESRSTADCLKLLSEIKKLISD